jgi:hypothetical protein
MALPRCVLLHGTTGLMWSQLGAMVGANNTWQMNTQLSDEELAAAPTLLHPFRPCVFCVCRLRMPLL